MNQPEHRRCIMPEIYTLADAAWIQEQLLMLPPTLRQKAAIGYAEVYQAAFDAEPVSYRQENRARFAANTRLRLFVRKHYRALQGYTEQPQLA